MIRARTGVAALVQLLLCGCAMGIPVGGRLKGPGYRAFFEAGGKPKRWYETSGKFKELMDQAAKQAKMAEKVGLELRWHVAEREWPNFFQYFSKKEASPASKSFTHRRCLEM